jgi:hypothetical protein
VYLMAFPKGNKIRLGARLGEEQKRRISEVNKGKKVSDETRKKMSEAQKGKKFSDEHRRRCGEALKGRKFSEEARKNMSLGHIGNKSNLGRHLTEEHKKHISESGKGRVVSEETREKLRLRPSAMKGRHHSEESKKKMSDARWGKPIPNHRLHLSEEHKKKCSMALKGLMAGEKSPNWHGGISFLPYCPKFNYALKEEIREKFGRRCYLCQVEENGSKLHVHHINFDRMAGCFGRKFNLVPLCKPCHIKTSNSRHYYFNLLINYWAFNPEINLTNLAQLWENYIKTKRYINEGLPDFVECIQENVKG